MKTAAKTIIKINDKLVEISLNEKGNDTAHRILSDDEAAEFYLLTKPDNADMKLQDELNEMIVRVTKDMKSTFETTLKENILRILGFGDRWNSKGWEIDHCNSRASIINDLVSSEVRDFVKQNVVKTATVLTKKDINDLIKAVRVDYLSKCAYHIKDTIGSEIRKQLGEHIANTVGELISGQEVEIQKTVADVLRGYKKIDR